MWVFALLVIWDGLMCTICANMVKRISEHAISQVGRAFTGNLKQTVPTQLALPATFRLITSSRGNPPLWSFTTLSVRKKIICHLMPAPKIFFFLPGAYSLLRAWTQCWKLIACMRAKRLSHYGFVLLAALPIVFMWRS